MAKILGLYQGIGGGVILPYTNDMHGFSFVVTKEIRLVGLAVFHVHGNGWKPTDNCFVGLWEEGNSGTPIATAMVRANSTEIGDNAFSGANGPLGVFRWESTTPTALVPGVYRVAAEMSHIHTNVAQDIHLLATACPTIATIPEIEADSLYMVHTSTDQGYPASPKPMPTMKQYLAFLGGNIVIDR